MKKLPWGYILAACLFIVIGILLTQMCKRTPETTPVAKVTIDSLVKVNAFLIEENKAKSDSIDRVVKDREDRVAEKEKTIRLITEKYNRLRQQVPPGRDTVVKEIQFLNGEECLEKMPILQVQLCIKDSVIDDLKRKCIFKDTVNMALQRQFDRSILLNKSQQGQSEKDAKKVKRFKRLGIAGVIVVVAGVIYATLH